MAKPTLYLCFDFDGRTGVAHPFKLRVAEQAITDEHRAVHDDVVLCHGDDFRVGESPGVVVRRKIHLADEPASEDIAVWVRIAGHRDHFDDQFAISHGEHIR